MEILSLGFMQNAFIGGIIISTILSILGVFAVLRKQSLFAEGIAHASLAGIAIGIVFFSFPLLWAIIIATIAAITITYIKLESTVSFDAGIGIVYSFFFALGIIILSISPKYTPEITSYLFGSILLISKSKIIISLLLLIFIILFLFSNYNKVVYMCFDEDAAKIRGVNIKLYNYILNILTSIAVVIGAELLGVVLITSLMVVAPTFSKLFANNFKQMLVLSIIYNIISVILGLILSYYIGIPSGATIVVLASLTYFVIVPVKKLLSK